MDFDLGAPTPDENTIRLFRGKLTRGGAIDRLFAAFDRSLREPGYLPMGGQIFDATLVAAPRRRNTTAERKAIKAGRTAAEIWPDEPAKAARKDTDARCPMAPSGDRHRHSQLRLQEQHRDLPAVRLHPKGKVTDGARFDGRMLPDVVTRDSTASNVWAV